MVEYCNYHNFRIDDVKFACVALEKAYFTNYMTCFNNTWSRGEWLKVVVFICCCCCCNKRKCSI